MEFVSTALPGCYEIRPRMASDARGVFVKTFHRELFDKHGLRSDWAEQYYSLSKAGVVRGLHFQLPPHDHAKLVYCISGRVMDVAVDLRKGSPTYGHHISINLDANKANMLYLPEGLAHGFSTYEQEATLVYNVTSVYAPSSDAGIRWDSVGINWPHTQPELSERDSRFPKLSEFNTPFDYGPINRSGAPE